MTEFANKNKSLETTKNHVNVGEIEEENPLDKMDEETLPIEQKNEETINGFNDKLTSNITNNEVFSTESFQSTKSSENGGNINCILSSNEINDKTYSCEILEQARKDAYTNTEDNQLSNQMDDEVLSDESDDGNFCLADLYYHDIPADFKLYRIKNNILDCVSLSDGFFKSQQVGESDLTISEKRKIASNLLSGNVPLFLQRYWKFIEIEDVSYFDRYKSNYEVNFYVNEIMKLHNTKISRVRIKNRRYEALKRMVDEGSYFSDAEMKKRNPFVYDQMIGQHLTEKERIAAYKEQYPDKNFSAFLLNQMDKNVENCLFERQKNEDEAIVEEEDDDTEEDESELEDDEPVKKIVTGEEKKKLRSEFINIMYESFLDGKDKEFDYSSVDNNVDFDPIHQRDIDEQEKYFDEDSSDNSD